MMAKTTMSLHGFEALQRAIKQAPELVRVHAADVVAKTAFASYRRMLATVPVATGNLRRSLDWSNRGLSGRVVIKPEGFYWRFIEYGTVKMPASPFIRPAAEAEAPIYIDRMRAIGPKLERAWPSGSTFL